MGLSRMNHSILHGRLSGMFLLLSEQASPTCVQFVYTVGQISAQRAASKFECLGCLGRLTQQESSFTSNVTRGLPKSNVDRHVCVVKSPDLT